MSGAVLDYQAIMRDVFLEAARRVLAHAAEHGIQGETHFYVSFLTTHPGVVLSPRVKARHPQQITIVLQHEFYDLAVGTDRFSVGLSFDGVFETVVVPFAALTRFVDPSGNFGFEIPMIDEEEDESSEDEDAPEPSAPEGAEKERASSQVVSLDAFRKR